jgi:polar amino acid transport system substrate-binding protein
MASALLLTGCSTDSGDKPSLKSATLDTPTIASSGVLRVGVNADKSPLAGTSDGKTIGIDVDVAAALADELGLKVEIVDVGSSPDTAIKNNTVDVVLGVESSDSYSGVWVSDQYLQTGIVLFALEGSGLAAPTASSAPKVSAQVSSKSAWAVTNVFGSSSLTSASDLSNAFTYLKNGTVSYVAADAVVGDYAAHRAGIDTTIVAVLDGPSGYCAAASATNSALQTAVANALSTIKANGTIDVIQKKWLGNTINLTNVTKVAASSSATTDSSTSADTTDDSASVEASADTTAAA